MKSLLPLSVFLVGFTFAEMRYLSVDEVTVKTSAENSLVAKQKAQSISSRKAFGQMLDENFPQAASLKTLASAEQIRQCVYDYSINREKFSGKVYIGEFSFRFSTDEVKKLLRDCRLIPEEKAEIQQLTAIYKKDYLKHSDLFADCEKVRFTNKIVVLRADENLKNSMKERKISFEEVEH